MFLLAQPIMRRTQFSVLAQTIDLRKVISSPSLLGASGGKFLRT